MGIKYGRRNMFIPQKHYSIKVQSLETNGEFLRLKILPKLHQKGESHHSTGLDWMFALENFS